MNNRDSAALRHYYRNIRGWLPCSGKEKARILGEIQASIDTYLAEFPQANFTQIQAHFGSPQQIASGYVEDLGTGETLRALKLRKRVLTIVGAVALAILLLWAGVLTWAAIESNNTDNGYYVDELYPSS